MAVQPLPVARASFAIQRSIRTLPSLSISPSQEPAGFNGRLRALEAIFINHSRMCSHDRCHNWIFFEIF
ncbi:hypothetical protein [Poseidonia sp.]|uniref:hypothetical protein n=1 Tax=Poseidonia sp. TaxID=2666344 RepID=UPI003F69A2D3